MQYNLQNYDGTVDFEPSLGYTLIIASFALLCKGITYPLLDFWEKIFFAKASYIW